MLNIVVFRRDLKLLTRVLTAAVYEVSARFVHDIRILSPYKFTLLS